MVYLRMKPDINWLSSDASCIHEKNVLLSKSGKLVVWISLPIQQFNSTIKWSFQNIQLILHNKTVVKLFDSFKQTEVFINILMF